MIDPSDQIKREFARRRYRRGVLGGICILLWFGLLFLARSPKSVWYEVLPYGFVVIVIAMGVVGFWNWRCPACKRFLGGGVRSPKFCRNCGVALE